MVAKRKGRCPTRAIEAIKWVGFQFPSFCPMVVCSLLLPLSLILATEARAAPLREPCVVPSNLPDPPRGKLLEQRTALIVRRAELKLRGERWNDSQCVRGGAEEGSPDESFCRSEYELLTEIRRTYQADTSRFCEMVDRAQQMKREIDRLKARIKNHQQAIRHLGFLTSVAQFEDWEILSKSTKDEFERTALNAVFGEIFNAAEAAARFGKSLNPWSVNVRINEFKKAGINSPKLFAIMRKMARIKDKPAKVEATVEFLRELQVVTSIGLAADPTSKESQWRAVASVLSLFVKDLGLRWWLLQVNRADFTVSAVYSFWVIANTSAGVKQLTQATEAQLKGLQVIDKLMVSDMKALRAARTCLDTLSISGAVDSLSVDTHFKFCTLKPDLHPIIQRFKTRKLHGTSR
jgi:hypothetical protein